MVAGLEKFVEAQQSMINFTQSLGAKAIEGNKKLAALNFAAAEAAMTENAAQFKSMFSEVKDPADFFKSFNPTAVQPAAEKAQAYFKHAYEISQQTTSEITSLLQEQAQATRSAMDQTFAGLTKNAPAGAKNYFDTVSNMFKAVEQTMTPEAKPKRK